MLRARKAQRQEKTRDAQICQEMRKMPRETQNCAEMPRDAKKSQGRPRDAQRGIEKPESVLCSTSVNPEPQHEIKKLRLPIQTHFGKLERTPYWELFVYLRKRADSDDIKYRLLRKAKKAQRG